MITTSKTRLLPLALALALTACGGGSTSPGPSALSIVERGETTLTWLRLDPDRAIDQRQETLAALTTAAKGPVYVGWRADLAKAIVWVHPGYEPDAKAVAWEVDVATHNPLGVEVKGPGTVMDMGWDAEGNLLALSMELHAPIQEPQRDARGRYLTYEGKRFDVPEGQEGIPVLVHALRRDGGGAWAVVETALSTTGWDYAAGTSVLEASKRLGPRSNEMLEHGADFATVEDPKLVAKLKPMKPADAMEGDEWSLFKGAPVYSWTVSGEFVHPTSRLVMLDPAGEPQPLPDMSGRVIAASFRGDRMLIADGADGGHPRLFDLKTRGIVYSSETATGATFWPGNEPAAPPPSP